MYEYTLGNFRPVFILRRFFISVPTHDGKGRQPFHVDLHQLDPRIDRMKKADC